MAERTAKYVLASMISDPFADAVQFFRAETDKKDILVRFRPNPENNYQEICNITSEDFKQWLFSCYKGRSKSDFNNDYEKLLSVARFDENISIVNVFKRVGYYHNNIYIDMCNKDCKVVKISDNSDGQAWTIIDENEITDPILFQRTQGMKELPEPKLGDRTLKELLGTLINVNDTDLSLIMSWLLIALNPHLTCPILFLNARKGQGKSTTTKVIKSIIDPDVAGALSPFNTGRDFNVIAVSRYILPLDNLGKITPRFSNQLCRAVTGAGISNRKLYTDYEYIDKKIKSHIILNGIDYVPARSDLRDRCYFVSMQKLDAQHRKLDSELKREFEDTQAEILGVLLTALHGGLVSNHEPKFDFDVRMLDAATFACKCINADKENILQISEDDFKRALASMKIETDEKEIQEDELTEVLYEMAISEYETERRRNPKITEITLWEGTTKEFLKKIQKFTRDTFGKAKVKKLPENTRRLGKKLGAKSQLRPILEQTGFSFKQHREGGTGNEGWIITFRPADLGKNEVATETTTITDN